MLDQYFLAEDRACQRANKLAFTLYSQGDSLMCNLHALHSSSF